MFLFQTRSKLAIIIHFLEKEIMATPVKVIQSQAVKHLFTRLRDKNTETEKFVYYANRLMRILAEEGIAELPQVEKTIQTP